MAKKVYPPGFTPYALMDGKPCVEIGHTLIPATVLLLAGPPLLVAENELTYIYLDDAIKITGEIYGAERQLNAQKTELPESARFAMQAVKDVHTAMLDAKRKFETGEMTLHPNLRPGELN